MTTAETMRTERAAKACARWLRYCLLNWLAQMEA